MMNIRPIIAHDIAAVTEIYNYYIRHTTITFEEEDVTVDEMAQRVANITAQFPWFVLEADGTLAGYAYANVFKARSAYRFTVETTVYLNHTITGKGYGTALYQYLLAELKGRGIKNAIGVIAIPNPASVKLHEKLGFQQVGHFKSVGWKFEQWLDVGYWQCVL
jgi:L-amino acid N-acyltransferase YncA